MIGTGTKGFDVRTIVVVVLIAVSLAAAGCSSSNDAEPAPTVDSVTEAELQARAFMRACQEANCPGAPIYAPDTTSDPVRQAIVEQYTDEVLYLSQSEIEARYSSIGRFNDGATMLEAQSVHHTERDDVRRVDVWISRGQYDFVGRTYLFLWDGTQWADTTPDAVSVTVTTSVS
jgi:hypothetical protein